MYWPLITGILMLAALCIGLACYVYNQRQYIKLSTHINDDVLRNVAAYVLLVDSDFNVLQTNYYSLTGTQQPAKPSKVGNLLHCKNGMDAGICGTHTRCASCSIRNAIVAAFRMRRNFTGLETTMTLYTSDECIQSFECDVCVSGNCLSIENQSRLVLTVHDISAQKRLLRELDEARKHAEESDRMKSFFLANTSHELRTPLNAIVGFSELLAAGVDPEEKQEYMHIIRSNSEVLLQLVNDILDLSKIEAGTLQYEYSQVELNTVMEELEGGFRLKQSESSPVQILFHREYPACHINTDRKRLWQVIANFLSNAVKFTSSGSIDFGFEIRDQEIYIYVSDTGAGIPEEDQARLFKRFVKIGSHYKQGVGIGLAISKSIVESMGGQIGATSEVGKGSTFWFTLPYNSQGE